MLVLLLAAPASAAVHLSVAPGPMSPDEIKLTVAATARLLEAPVRTDVAGGLDFTAPSWKNNLAPAERERQIRALETLWGERLTVRDDSPAVCPPTAKEPPPSAFDYRARTDAMRARLEGTPRPLGRTGQDRFYDGTAGQLLPSPPSRRPGRRPAARGKRSAPKLKPAPPAPPAPATAAPISWKRASGPQGRRPRDRGCVHLGSPSPQPRSR